MRSLNTYHSQHFHQISIDCIEKLVEYTESFDIGEIDADTCFKVNKQSLTDEIDDPEFLTFAIRNFSEMFEYVASGIVKINVS